MTIFTPLFLLLCIGCSGAPMLTASTNSALSPVGLVATLGSASLQNRNAINGLVASTSGRPLNRVRVELCDEVEMMIMQTYTDSTGRYSFRNLSQGTFIIKVHSDGAHISQKARVSLAAFRGAHHEQLDFTLKPVTEAKGATVPANSGSIFVQEVPESARKAYERALKQLENSKQVEQGISSLQEAIGLFPNYFVALERLGVEYVKRQEYDPARTTLTKAAMVNADGVAALYALGVAQYHLRQWPEASESLRRSLLLAPESPNAAFAHFYRGLALVKASQAADAETHLRKAYELGANAIPPEVHMHLAQIYSNNKRYRDAANQLELFLKRTPDARDAENIKQLIRQLRAKA